MAKDLENLPKFYIRGDISPGGGLFALMGETSTVSAKDLVDFLDANKEAKEIVIEISSDGGYKSEGVEMYQLLKNCGKTVNVIVYKANSIATVVTLGGTEGHRFIAETAPFNVHFARVDPMSLGMDFLTADDLQTIATEIQQADVEIINLYCRELGEEKRSELLAAMAEERDLGAKGAIKLGFVNGYYKKMKKVVAPEDLRRTLITDKFASIIQNNMSDNKKIEGLEAGLAGLKKMFVQLFKRGDIRNELRTLQDGTTKIDLQVANPEQPENLVGAKVFSVDADGVPTTEAIADGEYTLDDGRTLVVVAGAVTEVREAVDVEKLKNKLSEAEQQVANLTQERDALKTQIANIETKMQEKINEIQMKFEDFKKGVPGDPDPIDPVPGDGKKKKDFAKMSRAERLLEMRKEEKFK